ncbi:Saccharopine dehydrogenase [NADP(+), L-glutamate-forming] [Neolecta irregularis DAH-3]|uniref:Saccharopine dehydrogenase [NADP(+), L-glutamate-forming] n=1 Tax=Neolecta irregularis (strain DAH-3) TaxID=1198029 RepID=A0A1U7LH39_NEOID|nr:Saccharopine dehydrogenase [NADP(+), L-glutamate-forming] [Neolecta irregularis DAH-3]|eukprot:OLL21964.1 Saccharopine dehydrogenase [NADP(+), L-glutamate-forming] [Neolecta irregularis DAH-3]
MPRTKSLFLFKTNIRHILLLGSGFVAKPCLDYLARRPENKITVACRTLEKAQILCKDIPSAHPISLDVTNSQDLDILVAKNDIVVSLIPYIFHVDVIKSAIKMKTNVVTTSYISPAMQHLDQAAKDAGIVVLNEIGLDPGLDHLFAIKTIDKVHQQGGKIKSFLSYCGGLPAPENSDNPLGYKFSWSSRGVLQALLNPAKFWENNTIVQIPGDQLMKFAQPYFIFPGFAFVAYPNRDSSFYKERYQIPEAETIIRGTLRYQGFPEFIKVLVDIGLLDDTECDIWKTNIPWNHALSKTLGSASPSEKDLIQAISSKTSFNSAAEKARIVDGLRWLGLFSSTPITPRNNPLDTLCATLESLMHYEKGERDMVMLQHRFQVELQDGTLETQNCTLLEFGKVDGYTAMAKLVGTPCAIATSLILDGILNIHGVWAPTTSLTVEPLLRELEKEGITCKENIVRHG